MPENKEVKDESDEFGITDEIEDTLNFDELYEIIEQKEEIIGSKEKYKAEYLIALINDFRSIFKKLSAEIQGLKDKDVTKEKIEGFLKLHSELLAQFNKITRKKGLRLKVLQLILREINKVSA